ncbi:MAG: sigma-70 family RNA polymerase sigma factor, partial [Bacteroidota bacterium]
MAALWTSRAPVAPAEPRQAATREEPLAPQPAAARRAEEARTLLIMANLPIVGEVLRKYQGRRLALNIDLDDLRQVGRLAVIAVIDQHGLMRAPSRSQVFWAIKRACDRYLKEARDQIQTKPLPERFDPETGETAPIEVTGETIKVKLHPVPSEVAVEPVNTAWLTERKWTRALMRRFHPRTKGEVFEIEATAEFRSWKARLDQRRDRAAERKDGLDANDGCQDLEFDEYDAFRALSSRDQTIVRLLFNEGLPQREIAARVGIAQQTVAWVKKRFEKRLHPELRRREPTHAEERCSWLMTRPWYRARPSRDDTVE